VAGLFVRFSLVLFMMVFGLVMVFFRMDILPDKYSYDSDGYEYASTSEYSGVWVLGDSKENTARVYSILGYGYSVDPLVANLSFFLFGLMFILPVLFLSDFKGLDVVWVLGLYIIFSVYTVQYTKEHLAMLVVSLACALMVWKRYVFSCLLVLFYSVYFRSYFFLFYVLSLATYMLLVLGLGLRVKIFLIVGMYLSCIVALSILLGGDLSSIRYDMNDHRVGSVAAESMILPLFSSGGYAVDILNSVVSVVELVIPFRLVLNGSLLYLAFSVFQIGLIIFLVNRKRFVFASNAELMVLSNIVAFIFVQSLYVPDYGAYLRHVSAIVPLIILFLGFKGYSLDRRVER